MFAHEGAEVLDVVGPLDVFACANSIHLNDGGTAPLYRVVIAAHSKDIIVRTSAAIRLVSDAAWEECAHADTLLVAGGPEAETAPAEVVRALRKCAPGARRVASICTGAFILARAGLLAGRRATTHWLRSDALRRLYPEIDVQEDAIFTKDGPVYTSAGVTAGIDLALALLEEDQGRELALSVARTMVVYAKRPGGQSQFSTNLLAQFCEGGNLAPTVAWIRENYKSDLNNEMLAAKASMSLRNFARVFKQEIGTTPANFVERLRLEAAVKLLEQTTEDLETTAHKCGFRSGEHLRMTFVRHFGVAPRQYRDHFSSPHVLT